MKIVLSRIETNLVWFAFSLDSLSDSATYSVPSLSAIIDFFF